MVIAAYSGKLSKWGLLEPHPCTWQPRASMPASSSSSTDPPAANAQSGSKRLQNRTISKMAAKQTRHRREARQYLTCLYMGLKTNEKLSSSFFNPAEFGLYRYKDLPLAEATANSSMPASSSSSTDPPAAKAQSIQQPASSSSSADPPAAKAQSISKRFQNRPMSRMAAKQSTLRMEARQYLTRLYKRAAGSFWIFLQPYNRS